MEQKAALQNVRSLFQQGVPPVEKQDEGAVVVKRKTRGSGARKSRGSKSRCSDLDFWTDFGHSCDPRIVPKSSQTQVFNT